MNPSLPSSLLQRQPSRSVSQAVPPSAKRFLSRVSPSVFLSASLSVPLTASSALRALVASVALSVTGLMPLVAHAAQATQSTPVDPTATALKATLQSKLGTQANVTDVRKSPIAGLYEITVGKQVIYSDPTGHYLVLGNIRDTTTGQDLTQNRSDEINRIDFAKLPFGDAVKVVHGNGARKIAVFSDPNCPYCHRLEETLQNVKNVTVYTFLYPILSEDSAVKAKQIWCAKEPGKAWENWMLNRTAPPSNGDCNVTALGRNLQRGQDMNVTGTPTIFLADGNRLPGAVSADDLEKAMSAAR